ncbi:MAG: C69 family dipeptidase [Planctomycetota bacterium]
MKSIIWITRTVAAVFAVVLASGPVSLPCTIINVGKKASADGSVMTSHTCDSREDRTWVTIVPCRKHEQGEECPIYENMRFIRGAALMDTVQVKGKIPQVAETYGFINSAYPCMNEHQLAIGESTFGGRAELRNEKALLRCEELCRLALERCTTARDAIRLIDELTKEYGYSDEGECLTLADKDEVWQLEIVGCGKDAVGAVWVAQRIPDERVGVSANGSRIMELQLDNPEMFMASTNVVDVAVANGWWDPESGTPFRFCYAYDPEGRRSMATRRREWRVFDLLAPSLKLDPNAETYPFSVKPDQPVTVARMMECFRDTFEGTEFDMTKFMMVPAEDGKMVKSPYANPFMHYDMMPLFHINGGWGRMGERCIARYYCTYVTITQSRDWLPDPIGGLVWFGWDNPAMTAYAPLYCGIGDLPACYKVCGRERYSEDCAWWAFNRVSDLAAQKWGEMRVDVDEVRVAIEKEAFAVQESIERQALELHGQDPAKARAFLTNYVMSFCSDITRKYWDLGDHLWTKYTGKF